LTARAFGASGIVIADFKDKAVERSIEKIVRVWGGDFWVRSGDSWREVVEEWKKRGKTVVHLTMYGKSLQGALSELRGKDLMVVVGSEKVPREVYEVADFNVAIGNQPHSEVAALAVFLDRLFEGKELHMEFKGGKMRVIPSERGKRVEKIRIGGA